MHFFDRLLYIFVATNIASTKASRERTIARPARTRPLRSMSGDSWKMPPPSPVLPTIFEGAHEPHRTGQFVHTIIEMGLSGKLHNFWGNLLQLLGSYWPLQLDSVVDVVLDVVAVVAVVLEDVCVLEVVEVDLLQTSAEGSHARSFWH